jgi:hypothetical protein
VVAALASEDGGGPERSLAPAWRHPRCLHRLSRSLDRRRKRQSRRVRPARQVSRRHGTQRARHAVVRARHDNPRWLGILRR